MSTHSLSMRNRRCTTRNFALTPCLIDETLMSPFPSSSDDTSVLTSDILLTRLQCMPVCPMVAGFLIPSQQVCSIGQEQSPWWTPAVKPPRQSGKFQNIPAPMAVRRLRPAIIKEKRPLMRVLVCFLETNVREWTVLLTAAF